MVHVDDTMLEDWRCTDIVYGIDIADWFSYMIFVVNKIFFISKADEESARAYAWLLKERFVWCSTWNGKH